MPTDHQAMKTRAISGIFWKLMERVAAQGVTFAISIILARILSPDDYGIVSLVLIFFTFANVLISGGLNSGLIQKGNADADDYSTVFSISIICAIVIYVVMFACAPIISNVYSKPLLIPVIRIMGLTLPINAAKSIVCAYISSTFQFKKFFFATLAGTVSSAVVGIAMALNGYGAWAMVAQQMTNVIIDTAVLFLITKIKIRPMISKERFVPLFQYSWKVLVSSLINTAYNEIRPLVIGSKFSTSDLSFYSKGESFPKLVTLTVTNTLSAVMFPVLSSSKDDSNKLLSYTRRFIRITSFIIFPMMIGLATVSNSLVLLLLTEKWISAAYYIRVFAIAGMFSMINIGNCEVIKALGRSDIFLKMELIKKSVNLLVLLAFFKFCETPEMLAIASIVCVVVAIAVNTIPNKRLIGYKYSMQVSDITPNLITAVLMGAIVFCVGKLQLPTLCLFIVQVVIGICAYVIMNLCIKNENIQYMRDFIASMSARISKGSRKKVSQ